MTAGRCRPLVTEQQRGRWPDRRTRSGLKTSDRRLESEVDPLGLGVRHVWEFAW